MFLAIDRVSKFTYVELHPAATMLAGAAFLRGVIAAFPHRLHTVLTDNGITCPARSRSDRRHADDTARSDPIGCEADR